MNAIAAVKAMKYLYEFRQALKRDDHNAIILNHTLYSEWSVRPEEIPTSGWAKRVIERYTEKLWD